MSVRRNTNPGVLGLKESRCEVDLSHHPVLRLRIRGAIPLLLHCVFIAWAE
jgi:hypothetical protein